MIWLTTVLVVVSLGVIAVVAAGRGAPMIEEYDDRRDVSVPGDALRSRDLRHVRFAVTFRGYRMSEVDALLDRLADQLDSTERWASAESSAKRPHDDPDLGG